MQESLDLIPITKKKLAVLIRNRKMDTLLSDLCALRQIRVYYSYPLTNKSTNKLLLEDPKGVLYLKLSQLCETRTTYWRPIPCLLCTQSAYGNSFMQCTSKATLESNIVQATVFVLFCCIVR